jgi:hypothetical protein
VLPQTVKTCVFLAQKKAAAKGNLNPFVLMQHLQKFKIQECSRIFDHPNISPS